MSKIPKSNSNTEERPPSTPRWVKVAGIIIIVLILLVVIIVFFSGGKHGPGRHALGGEPNTWEVPNIQTPEKNQEQETGRSDNGNHRLAGGGY